MVLDNVLLLQATFLNSMLDHVDEQLKHEQGLPYHMKLQGHIILRVRSLYFTAERKDGFWDKYFDSQYAQHAPTVAAEVVVIADLRANKHHPDPWNMTADVCWSVNGHTWYEESVTVKRPQPCNVNNAGDAPGELSPEQSSQCQVLQAQAV